MRTVQPFRWEQLPQKRVVHHGRPWKAGAASARTLCRRGYWEPAQLTTDARKVTCAHCIAALPSRRQS